MRIKFKKPMVVDAGAKKIRLKKLSLSQRRQLWPETKAGGDRREPTKRYSVRNDPKTGKRKFALEAQIDGKSVFVTGKDKRRLRKGLNTELNQGKVVIATGSTKTLYPTPKTLDPKRKKRKNNLKR